MVSCNATHKRDVDHSPPHPTSKTTSRYYMDTNLSRSGPRPSQDIGSLRGRPVRFFLDFRHGDQFHGLQVLGQRGMQPSNLGKLHGHGIHDQNTSRQESFFVTQQVFQSFRGLQTSHGPREYAQHSSSGARRNIARIRRSWQQITIIRTASM